MSFSCMFHHPVPITRRLTMNSVAREKFHPENQATMIFDRLRRSAALLGIWAMSLIAASSASATDDASPWDGDTRSAVRLIAGSSPAPEQAAIRAGIAIRLKNGWHTYWRYPGDAGVPPRFDFAGSQNAKSVEVRWPAPQRISEQGLVAIGYTGDLILPLAIVPQNRAKPVKLRLKLDYAVCETLCVPAEGQVELVLMGGPSSRRRAGRGRSAGSEKGLPGGGLIPRR